MQKPVLVIKLGSAVITNANGSIEQAVIKKLAEEIAALCKTYKVVLV
jgi:glutamate 5-kinase